MISSRSMLLAVAIVTMAFAAPAQANDETIRASCAKDLKMNESECDCIVARVNDELSDKQMIFFMAAIQNDSAGMVTAQGGLTGEEMQKLTQFMTAAPNSCKGQ